MGTGIVAEWARALVDGMEGAHLNLAPEVDFSPLFQKLVFLRAKWYLVSDSTLMKKKLP